jgi:hypothetical protein
MASANPLAGGPDFVEILRNALEPVRHSTYIRPPFTGGNQVSVRLAQDRVALLDRLSERSGWNRNQIIDALIDKGLFVLFGALSDSTADEIMNEHAGKLMASRGR